MKRVVLATFVISLMSLYGCQQKGATLATASSPAASVKGSSALSPEELGVLGAKIRKDPAHAQQLLSERGLSESDFEAAIRKVAADPQASRRYAEAFRKTAA
jgi:hypothetical protein